MFSDKNSNVRDRDDILDSWAHRFAVLCCSRKEGFHFNAWHWRKLEINPAMFLSFFAERVTVRPWEHVLDVQRIQVASVLGLTCTENNCKVPKRLSNSFWQFVWTMRRKVNHQLWRRCDRVCGKGWIQTFEVENSELQHFWASNNSVTKHNGAPEKKGAVNRNLYSRNSCGLIRSSAPMSSSTSSRAASSSPQDLSSQSSLSEGLGHEEDENFANDGLF